MQDEIIPSGNGCATYVGAMANKLATRNEAFGCIQCTDKASGKVGSFFHLGDFVACSQVFPDVGEFFKLANAIGWELDLDRGPMAMRRVKA